MEIVKAKVDEILEAGDRFPGRVEGLPGDLPVVIYADGTVWTDYDPKRRRYENISIVDLWEVTPAWKDWISDRFVIDPRGSSRVRNLTSHPVTVLTPDGKGILRRYEPELPTPKARETVNCLLGTVDGGVPVHEVAYGASVDLPPPAGGTVLIVSVLTALTTPDRKDLVFPHGLVRDVEGRPVGCTNLARLSSWRFNGGRI